MRDFEARQFIYEDQKENVIIHVSKAADENDFAINFVT